MNEETNSEGQAPTSKYNDGDMIRFVRVRFPGNAKSFPFHIGSKDFTYGQRVVAMSDRGMDIGYVNSFPYEVGFKESLLPLQYISKVASEEDIAESRELMGRERQAEVTCIDLIEKHKLDMNLTHVELTQYGKKAVFYFTAPNRVDFRELVKDLVSDLRMRIELRQISVRDRAAAIGGIGPCGRVFCCSSFLNKYGQVGIKMAKNQNVALSGNKINGACDQLKCCLQYEDQVYSDKRKRLPKHGSVVKAKNGDIGKVTSVAILKEQFDLLTTKGIRRRYNSTQFCKKEGVGRFDFPTRFENITDERSTIIELVETPLATSTEQDYVEEVKSAELPERNDQQQEAQKSEKKKYYRNSRRGRNNSKNSNNQNKNSKN